MAPTGNSTNFTQILPILLMLPGFIKDVMSLMALASVLSGKRSSGFPYIGLAWYILGGLVGYFLNPKFLAIAGALIVFHIVVQFPLLWLNKRLLRNREDETKK